MSFCMVIPALDSNQYHKLGDLAPFGDTSLLEWKLAQCKEFVDNAQIYISSSSLEVESLARLEQVNFLKRQHKETYSQTLLNILRTLPYEHIIWTHCTTPFISTRQYKEMYQRFLESKTQVLISTRKIQEFIFYNEQKLNFIDNLSTRSKLKPAFIVSNGCFIFNRQEALELGSFFLPRFELFTLDNLSGIEIKDSQDYLITKELITMYFRREVLEYA